MTEIALRTYNQEIKDLTDHGRFDEAIAHCQHILETFPRHIETYRLLGKAFLEQGRHGDAADVFQRVLSAIPEDWLAHVAMAIVREDESNLDMAIWHMERAYEVNPSNPTVQQEVRRLRGRRDGVEPPKLRLTRSALARMYIKGGLYGQAIAEIRSALSEDPDRPDLQTLLASALHDSGAIQEAADICNALLQKLPYCMEANRVLGLVLWESEKKEDAEKLFQRIESLDPYIDIDTLKKEKRIAEHPAQSITLSRLEYEGQEKTVRTKQPSWASSLGLKIEESQQRQSIPDWLANASQQPSAFQGTPQTAASASPTGEVPSWINEAAAVMGPTSGVEGPSSGFPTPKASIAAEPPIARTATGELPDWIQAQAMPVEQPKQERPSGPLPDWLSAPSTPPPTAPATTAAGSTLPDWIKTSSLPPETPKEKITGIPDWLSTPPPPSVEALPYSSLTENIRPETKTGPLEVEPGNIPDWLNSSQPASPDLGPEPVWLKQPSSAKAISESIPEWMKGVSPIEPQLDAEPASSATPDWLREAPAAPSKPVESVPDWMRSETPTSAALAPEKSFPQMTLSDDIPEWMKPEPETSVEPPSTPVLGARAPVESAKSEPPPISAAAPEINFPDWMTSAPAEQAPSPAPPAENLPEAVPEAKLPDWLNAPPQQAQPMEESAPPITTAVPGVTLPDWLKPPEPSQVTAVEQAPQPSPPTTVEAPQEGIDLTTEESPAEYIPEIDLPDWLKAVPAPAASPTPTPPSRIEAAAEPASEAEMPDWLRGGSAQAQPQAMPTATESVSEPTPIAPPEPPPAAVKPMAAPAQPLPEMPQPGIASEPGPTHVTPTTTEGIDLPEWLVDQLQGKPKETSIAPAAEASSPPLPDWLKPAPNKSAAAPVLDWDKAASQPLPTLPVDATRPATGLSASSEEKPAGGSTEIPSWLDKSKPTGSDTVARWLDRRLKTSTLSSLDESVMKGAAKGPSAVAPGRPGTGSTQLPTWLDTQKPGGSDTVVRWMDKRETGSLRKPVTATFSSISKAAVPPPHEQIPAPLIASAPKSAEEVPAPGGEDTVTSKRAAPAIPVERAQVAPARITAASPPMESRISPPQSAVVAPPVKPPTTPLVTTAAPVEEEEEGAFVPPPEWLQKALGNAVAEVPPIPRKQTGSFTPGTVSPKIPIAEPKPPVAVRAEPVPVEEAAPAPAVRPGSWIPLATTPAPPVVPVQKPPKKSVRKKTRKLTDVESEAIIREARVYLETDLQKATEAYQHVIEDPASAEVVVGDLTTYLEQDPGSPLLWNLLGDACSKAGRLQDAYRAYAEALRRM